MIGNTLGHYQIVAKLGSGGMGDVYRAHDTKLGRDVALKVLHSDAAGDLERRKRFEREARAVASLKHPNIVTIHSVEEANGTHFITMELVEGQTLSALIPKNGLSLEQFFDYSLSLVDAIGGAHEQGITHRDLKPANIFVSPEGHAKVLDFGLAKLRDTGFELTKRGEIFGTPYYMSPEQGHGQPVDERSDLYSAGVVLYEMLTGRKPYVAASPMSIIWKHHHAPLPRLPQGIGGLQGLVNGLMAKSPEERFPSAEAVIEAVRAARGAPPPADEAPGTTAEGTLQAPDGTEEAN